ncbi:MAG TPA: hypothetical protein VD971_12150 [Phycisphaerales bacterium]|nr:hypothetical protein [Phycisphaerales bacterium]
MRSSVRLTVCLVALAGALAGCYQQSTYPAIPTARGYPENPNTPAAEQAIVAAVQYVASRWPPGNRDFDESVTPRGLPMVPYEMVVSLPAGTRKLYYDRMPAKIGPNVKPATPETVASGAPVFYVTRVWLRFSKGTVDVLRPMVELGSTPDNPIYQKVTVRLEGGIEPWHVQHARAWAPGEAELPEHFFVPAVDHADQYRITARGMNREPVVTEDEGAADEALGSVMDEPSGS